METVNLNNLWNTQLLPEEEVVVVPAQPQEFEVFEEEGTISPEVFDSLDSFPTTILPTNNVSPWPPRLTFDLAMGETPESCCEIHQITPEQLDRLAHNLTFRSEIAQHMKTIREEGLTFKNKARLQAEEYLEEVHEIVTNHEIPPTVRMAAIKDCVRWAGLEPGNASNQTSNQNQVNIQINI